MSNLADNQNIQPQNPGPTLFGTPEGHDARILADRAREVMADDAAIVHICLDEGRAVTLRDLLTFFAPDVKVLTMPSWDCLPYDRVSPHGEISAKRVATLAALLRWQKETKRYPRILLVTANAIAQKVIPKSFLQETVFNGEKGKRIDLDQLTSFLQINGYARTDTVREQGDYAMRGSIIDLFPPGYKQPLRLDLFGDEIDSIRRFDPVSQRTNKKIERFVLYPATEYFLDEESINRFRQGYREMFGVVRDTDPLYEAISEGRRYNGAEHWQPLFFDKMDTILDYVNCPVLSSDQHVAQSLSERLTQIEDFYDARQTLVKAASEKKKGDTLSGNIYHPVPVASLFLQTEQIEALASDVTTLNPFSAAEGQADAGGKKGRDFADIRAQADGDLFGAVSEYISLHRKDGRKTIIASYSEGSQTRLKTMMENAGFTNFKPIKAPDDLKDLSVHEIGLCVLALESGFISDDLIILTEQDILGDRLARKKSKRKKADNFLTEVSSLAPGDYVVHIEHGVGRFDGLETLEAAGTLHDCLKVTYAGDDRLFVPVENIDVLSRFGNSEGIVQMDRLGGAGWQARKAKVKKDLMIMADKLLKLAAARTLQKAQKLEVSNDLYNEFTAKFPYHETDDQQRSINDVLDDLGNDHPMDRLVCGDVGFGKTEVALRAAYVAAMNGTQVAVVVPTTLLARQHYNNFLERFKGTGLRVEQLSRLVSSKDTKAVKEGLADGTVNIVVGTHALFGSSIDFSNLGLLIVDEEQRFGVKQKEKLKQLKANIHVLTLTATPIPRTLQMSLTGVRDLSLITTPPVDRLAIRTFVLPFDPVVIREAILREHYRGGQTFYVCPRIKDLEEVEESLKELVPEVKVIAAHGQMTPTELEDRMTAFYEGEYNILLATNIIESGLDIPRANTMIVHRADLFGLAQLYQIRGRIGRSKVRAYAYMTYEANKVLTPQAQKRLEVLETLDTLGAGFQLASHDMDIRGAGNLLGDQQSGHIKEVGVELYQQMLEEAVAAAREGLDWEGEGAPEKWSPQINLGTSVLIPDHYVEDLNVRMSLYRRLSDLEGQDDIESFAAELIDRFGKLPDEVENLLQIIEIKQLCRAAGIARVDAGPKGAVIGFHNDTPANPAAIMQWIAGKGASVKLRPDQKLVAMRGWESETARVKGVRILMRELAKVS